MQILLEDLNVPQLSALGNKTDAKSALWRLQQTWKTRTLRVSSIQARSELHSRGNHADKVFNEGVVWKRGRWNSAYKRRHFVLERSEIKYYSSKEAWLAKKSSLGSMSCSGMTIKLPHESEGVQGWDPALAHPEHEEQDEKTIILPCWHGTPTDLAILAVSTCLGVVVGVVFAIILDQGVAMGIGIGVVVASGLPALAELASYLALLRAKRGREGGRE